MPAYRVYYDNGTTFDDDPAQAPGVGVLAIVQPDPDHGRIVLSRWDFYCWHPGGQHGQWFGHDQFGLFDCLTQPGWRRVIFGRTVSTARFRAIHQAAEDDPDFPARSAVTPRERAVVADA